MFHNKEAKGTTSLSFKKFAVTAKKLEKASKAKETLNRNTFLKPVKKHVSAACLNNFTKGFILKFERKPPTNKINHRSKSGVFAARLEGNLEKVIVENQKEIAGKKFRQERSFYNLPADKLFQLKKTNLSILQLNEGSSQGKFKPKVTSTPNDEQVLREIDLPSFSIKKEQINQPDDIRKFPLYNDISHISKNILKEFNKRSSDRRSILERDLIFLKNLNEVTTSENLLLEDQANETNENFDDSLETIPSYILDESNSSDNNSLDIEVKKLRRPKENLVSLFFNYFFFSN